MKTLLILMVVCLLTFAETPPHHTSVYQITASRVLKTGDRTGASKAIQKAVEDVGGWLLIENQDYLALRVPAKSVDTLLLFIDRFGLVTDRNYARTDRTDEFLRLTASIEAKESLLAHYLRLLDSSGTEGIYPVSKSIADIQESIETCKGQLTGMFERMEYAEVRVHFNFFDRRPPLTSGHSDFRWLNSVNLPSLLKAFQ